MLFEKVKEEHIIQGIKDYERKGLPNGFGASSTYDLVYRNKTYPPKAIMAYANFYASGRKIERYFKGGLDTDCFKAFERNGFKIEKKSNSMNEKLYKLKQEFLDYWTLDRLQNMTLEEYTDTKRENSFCYWLEHITRDLGSIVGGSSYKFGIYKMGTTSKTEPATNRDNDGIYAWHTKYGKTSSEAFYSIKNLIIDIANYTKENNLKPIDNIDLGDAFKWKIAFLYSDFGVVNMFKKEALEFIAKSKYNIGVASNNYSELNSFILSNNKDKDFFEFTKEIWKHYQKFNSKASEFKKWLDHNNDDGSNKNSSYLRAIKILTSVFNIEVYTETDIDVLQDLYEDLIINQKDPKGKFAYHKRSYGEKGFYSAAIKTYIKFLKNEPLSKVSETPDEYQKIIKFNSMKTQPLNQILYGPPGTGKTYKTKELAVNIVLGEEKRSRSKILQLYNDLITKEKISFTTFHQSMSYEDFVEGIKPKMEDNEETLKYQIEKGIFKKIADKSKGVSGSKQKDNSIDFSKSNYFKMSIGGKHRIDLHNWCIHNNLVALGWGDNEDYTEYNKIDNWNEFRDKFNKEFPYLVESSIYHRQAMFTFQKMKIGDIVLVSLGNHILDAIGIVQGNYEYDPENKFGFHHHRKVKWLSTNMNASPDLFVDKGISQQSIYEFYKQDIKIESFKDYFSEIKEEEKITNHVLIIDEINRGNISSIFGELITLLEEDKRSGQNEEIEVILPYSKEPFKVPFNLYIIGTMNTADRSVEALDTALRRRFSFTEVAPDSTLLEDIEVEEIELKKLLQTINDRIELLIDKDHKIGHSYFLNIETLEDLKDTFKNKVVPLLEEYFFGDYGKIGLVLGSDFIKLKDDEDKISFAKNFTEKYEEAENLREKAIYTFTNEDTWEASSFISIYE